MKINLNKINKNLINQILQEIQQTNEYQTFYENITNLIPYIGCNKSSIKILASISGGQDSMFMLYCFKLLQNSYINIQNIDLNIITFDHQLRPESKDEVIFVEYICNLMDLNCYVKKININNSNGNLMQNARKARYNSIKETANNINALYVATGHQWNDQIENILIRKNNRNSLFFAIPMTLYMDHYKIIRPIINIKRIDIFSILNKINNKFNISLFMNDKSNNNLKYQRALARDHIKNMSENEIRKNYEMLIQNIELLNHSLYQKLQISQNIKFHSNNSIDILYCNKDNDEMNHSIIQESIKYGIYWIFLKFPKKSVIEKINISIINAIKNKKEKLKVEYCIIDINYINTGDILIKISPNDHMKKMINQRNIDNYFIPKNEYKVYI